MRIDIKSRYGEVRSFVWVSDNIYRFEGNTHWARFGANEDNSMNDLAFFDPDGGPFISKGFVIGDKRVVRIMSKDDGVYFEVE